MIPNHPTGGVALVTGGGGGIGGATAERLAANGVAVAIADNNFDNADDVRDRILTAGGTACAIALDVTDPRSMNAAIAEAEAALGPSTSWSTRRAIFSGRQWRISRTRISEKCSGSMCSACIRCATR